MTTLRLNRLMIAISCIAVLSLPIFIAGCGDEGEVLLIDDNDEVPTVNFIDSTPQTGGEIIPNGTLTLTFDNPPGAVTVIIPDASGNIQNGIRTAATVQGNTATWNAIGLIPGQATTLVIEWTNTDGSGPNTTRLTLTVKAEDEPKISFQKEIFPIFQANCLDAGCHGANPPSGLLLTTYDNFKKGGNGGASFVPNNSKNSLIVQRITGVVQPQMPLGRPPLSQKDIDAIKNWIDSGAENN